MGRQVARLGDIGKGVCTCHKHTKVMTGKIISGSANVKTNARLTARYGDKVLGNCGHTGTLIMGSSSVKTNSRKTVRFGDKFVGCFKGTIMSGSANVRAG